jgi:hypothetical protein
MAAKVLDDLIEYGSCQLCMVIDWGIVDVVFVRG